MKIFVTGGCGFIGTHLIDYLLTQTSHEIINLDLLTYASNKRWVGYKAAHPQYRFIQGDVTDPRLLQDIFQEYRPHAVMHLAAETHVDQSIHHPHNFLHTNVIGTERLLGASLNYWRSLNEAEKVRFRYLQVSTDEVYGDLAGISEDANEEFPYRPSSPYSASKASADHLVRAWHRTYGLPTLITCCSNNYGTFQHSEKLIPHLLQQALQGNPIPIYGDGTQIRDWLHVSDHVHALYLVLTLGRIGDTYNIGAHTAIANNQLIVNICELLDDLAPEFHELLQIHQFSDLMTYVEDRAGHDRRYGIDASKITRELGWKPKVTLEQGLRDTLDAYLHGH